jgi:apolipoprotein N-acyltransferase
MMRQAGQAGAGILLAPAHDWAAIDPVHTQKATFRAIENGVGLVREANEGLSLAVDSDVAEMPLRLWNGSSVRQGGCSAC